VFNRRWDSRSRVFEENLGPASKGYVRSLGASVVSVDVPQVAGSFFLLACERSQSKIIGLQLVARVLRREAHIPGSKTSPTGRRTQSLSPASASGNLRARSRPSRRS